ncbi:MAG: hypothetical protein RIF33_19905, partial [Cyclobacteriaceae bacterium]
MEAKDKVRIRIIHKPSGDLIAEGTKGWGMFSFEGNYYISDNYLKTPGFSSSWIPGLCPYKFIYFWYHFRASDGSKSPMLGWKYWIP